MPSRARIRRRRHAAGADQRHDRELPPFADVQRHHLDAVVCGVERAGRVAAQLVRQLAFAQEFGALIHFARYLGSDSNGIRGQISITFTRFRETCDQAACFRRT